MCSVWFQWHTAERRNERRCCVCTGIEPVLPGQYGEGFPTFSAGATTGSRSQQSQGCPQGMCVGCAGFVALWWLWLLCGHVLAGTGLWLWLLCSCVCCLWLFCRHCSGCHCVCWLWLLCSFIDFLLQFCRSCVGVCCTVLFFFSFFFFLLCCLPFALYTCTPVIRAVPPPVSDWPKIRMEQKQQDTHSTFSVKSQILFLFNIDMRVMKTWPWISEWCHFVPSSLYHYHTKQGLHQCMCGTSSKCISSQPFSALQR